MVEPVAAEEKHRSAMKMRVTVGAEAALMCLKRSAPPDAVEDAPSLDPWLKATSDSVRESASSPDHDELSEGSGDDFFQATFCYTPTSSDSGRSRSSNSAD